MIRFGANYFDGRTASARRAAVEAEGGFLTVSFPDGGEPLRVETARCEIVPALGGGHRTVRLPDDLGHLETAQSGQVELLEKLEGQNRGAGLLHRMESRWRFALAALLVGGFLVYGGARYLVPTLADRAALALPAGVSETLGQGALESLDRGLFKPTALSEERRAALGRVFDDFCAGVGLTGYRLVFRSFPPDPNAFALPDGTIVLTDEMIAFAADEGELLAVLSHEAAHVARRHALRQLLRHAGAWALVTLSVGDASAIVSAASTLPTMLIERGYGREFEIEADVEGAALLKKSGRSVDSMVSLLTRLAETHPGGGRSGDLLSTHPEMKSRVERLKNLR